MEIYSLDNLTLREVKALRKSLDFIPITGVDALFIGSLQLKMNEQIQQIETHINSPKDTKNQSLEKAIDGDKKMSKIAFSSNK
jgi:maleate cis-trans isomerase